MEDSNLNKLEQNVNFVINLIKDLMEENKKLKQQLNRVSKDNFTENNTNSVVEQQKIYSDKKDIISKDKEDKIKEKIKNALNKLNEIQIALS